MPRGAGCGWWQPQISDPLRPTNVPGTRRSIIPGKFNKRSTSEMRWFRKLLVSSIVSALWGKSMKNDAKTVKYLGGAG